MLNQQERFRQIPERIKPYILVREVNQSIPVLSGPFKLIGSCEGTLEGNLVFRWIPSTAIEFDGKLELSLVDLLKMDDWELISDEPPVRVPAMITRASPGFEISTAQGVLKEGFDLGSGSFASLRFCLANFPEYLGLPIRYESDEGARVLSGRLSLASSSGECRLDIIPEVIDLAKTATRSGSGFVITHTGEWLPTAGSMDVDEATDVLTMLHFWFAFLRGARCGPLFPQGLTDNSIIWQQFASWRVKETRSVTTWLPRHKPLSLASPFDRFVQMWNDPLWRKALISAISWLVEANSPRVTRETKIILCQVALELLAWVQLVEKERTFKPKHFDNKLSAAERVRELLNRLGIPAATPAHLSTLSGLEQGRNGGPHTIAYLRHALVHPKAKNRRKIGAVTGEQLFECSELGLQYLELSLLSLLGYKGHYAQRGWRGWRGEDEVLVP